MIALCLIPDDEFANAYQKHAPKLSSTARFGGSATIAGRMEAEFWAKRRRAG